MRIWKGRIVTKYVEVAYLDAFWYKGHDPYKVPRHNIRKVTGWLLEEDDDVIILGIDLPETDGADFTVVGIPKATVLAIDVLKEIKVPRPEDYF